MTTVPLETPGEDEADLKAALGALVGSELIHRGEISSPVNVIDLDLPAGYSRFILRIDGLTLSVEDQAHMAFSADGGATYISDYDNFDTYYYNRIQWHSDARGFVFSKDQSDYALRIASEIGGRQYYPTHIDAIIWPGSATEMARASVRSFIGTSTDWGLHEIDGHIYPTSTVPNSPARVNALRIVNGVDDFNDPVSSINFTGGIINLYGVP